MCGENSACEFVKTNNSSSTDNLTFTWQNLAAYNDAATQCLNHQNNPDDPKHPNLSFCKSAGGCVGTNFYLDDASKLPVCNGLAALTSANWECITSSSSYGYMGCEACNYMNKKDQEESYGLCNASSDNYKNPCLWTPDKK